MQKRKKAVTSKIMAAIKSRNTKPEKLLGKELWKLGLRYRKQYKIVGKPDFVFVRSKLAIFCDGDFWHGNNWKLRGIKSLKQELSGYSEYWAKKITANIERDKKVNKELKKAGWNVVRFWESEIKRNPERIATKILLILKKVNSG
ncbi:MAG: very short patch repair endonuclease [Candidatus Hodarchaeales archaeon]|jgi:DNA mismatch endonuclease (patch repair protein)